ncbi:methylaspartate mutase subunit S [Paenibacillus athensensis]|uniref:Glutamate mutase sigma subunit n=1 Tax=Paenibacillus athensensis TaxID=1967502 RepID=A0A4Y8Q833_9BACL|nr:methylaspartate mutase subunit S [Paenibacillus athensensis]MCD1257292.1 methylaspartate mutase subunit S [Paenibacillus athensensis]
MSVTIVLGVIGADCHAVGNKILEHTFTEAGFHVVNLGVLCAQEEFIHAAVETNARAILVSSLYGHGEIDCRGLKGKCVEAGLPDVLLYVGGNLVVGNHDWDEVRLKFEEMGFDRVYPPSVPLAQAVADLRSDLQRQHERRPAAVFASSVVVAAAATADTG